MKEIPILFSTPMVQAILEGRKSQTRRIAAVPVGDHHGIDIMNWGLSKHPYQENGKWLYNVQSDVDDHNTFELKPKYGQPGDLLWVRETWGVGSRPDPFEGSVDGIEFKADSRFIDNIESLPLHQFEDFDYGNYDKSGWRPSIHMPKSIARIWLQVTDIRVERLQDISEEDAKAEGVEWRIMGPEYKHLEGERLYKDYLNPDQTECGPIYAKDSFCYLWQSINGPESWQVNPWVWCISFKILSTTGKPK